MQCNQQCILQCKHFFHGLVVSFLIVCNITEMGMQELKRFPTLQADIAAASNDALERFRDESRKTVTRLVEMESSYLTVEFFRKLNTEPEKNSKDATVSNAERYSDNHLRRIGMSFALRSPCHQAFLCLCRKFDILPVIST